MSLKDAQTVVSVRARVEATLEGGATLVLKLEGDERAQSRAELALEAAKRALEGAEIGAEERAAVDDAPRRQSGFWTQPPQLLGKSRAIRHLRERLQRVRDSDAPVLITGENGTGKELVARAVHTQSRRATKPFVAVNCGAFNDNLLEVELFGCARGAFTGATSDRAGLFAAADGGTFFLDEVAEMSRALQVKLLRVLQEGTFFPVGSAQSRTVDVRVVAATHQNLHELVDEDRFRRDLFYRLHVLPIHVPALRNRSEDIAPLAQDFLSRLCLREGRQKSLSDGALAALESYAWPGNVRELENEIERAWIVSDEGSTIRAEHLSLRALPTSFAEEALRKGQVPEAPLQPIALAPAVEKLEHALITRALQRTQGNKTRAAQLLGISRRRLSQKVHLYGISEVAGSEGT